MCARTLATRAVFVTRLCGSLAATVMNSLRRTRLTCPRLLSRGFIHMGIMICPNCRARVLPKSDGTCPSCQSLIAEVEEPSVLKVPRASPVNSPAPYPKAGTQYREIVMQAWQLTWRNKYLWIFGFLAGLNFGGVNIGPALTQGGAWLFQNIGTLLTTRGLLSIVFVIISIAFWQSAQTPVLVSSMKSPPSMVKRTRQLPRRARCSSHPRDFSSLLS